MNLGKSIGLAAALLTGAFCLPSQAQPATPPAKEKFHLYLLMGQSNMAGRGKIDAEPKKSDPRVLVFTPDGNQWAVAKDPLHQKDGRTEPGVGPGISFALEMLKTDPGITIGLVPCAVGGTPLKRWQKKGGDLYARAIERAKLAEQAGVIMGVLWLQGESDSGKQASAERYEAGLAGMIKDLRGDLGQPDLPVVVGQIGGFLSPEKNPFVETVRAAIKAVSGKLPHTGYADSAGLTDKGDKLHYDTRSAHEMGRRFARAMLELRQQDRK